MYLLHHGQVKSPLFQCSFRSSNTGRASVCYFRVWEKVFHNVNLNAIFMLNKSVF
jgi:hypothetical protein